MILMTHPFPKIDPRLETCLMTHPFPHRSDSTNKEPNLRVQCIQLRTLEADSRKMTLKSV